MPTKRTRKSRNLGQRVTDEVIEAYIAGDGRALHRALRLRPWEYSPLPNPPYALGVDQEPTPIDARHGDHLGWGLAQSIQREIEAVLSPSQRRQARAAARKQAKTNQVEEAEIDHA